MAESAHIEFNRLNEWISELCTKLHHRKLIPEDISFDLSHSAAFSTFQQHCDTDSLSIWFILEKMSVSDKLETKRHLYNNICLLCVCWFECCVPHKPNEIYVIWREKKTQVWLKYSFETSQRWYRISP